MQTIDFEEARLRFYYDFHRLRHGICKTLKQKVDFDYIKPNMILDFEDLLAVSLLKIGNRSLRTGEFPISWKWSLITSVEKVANTCKCEEFRPNNIVLELVKNY